MTAVLRARWRLLDALLAAVLCAVFVLEVLLVEHPGPLWAGILTAVGFTVPLAWRRRHPLLVAAIVCAVIVQAAAWTLPSEVSISPLLPLLIAAYSLGAHDDRGLRTAWIGLVMTSLTVVAVSALMHSTVWGDYVFPTLIIGMGWVGGRLLRARILLTAELHEEAVRAEEERERHAELAVAEERRRIARELHDVVAHSMSVMVVQAGGARRIGERDPARAAGAAAQIERTGREALSEMRRLLGVLRVDGAETPLAPQPGMDRLAALVERARAAGLPVELAVEGDRRSLPAGVDLAGYRIVQEALTNAMKHAGSAPTSVRVRYGDDAVELEVANDEPARGATLRSEGAGHGLIGMRERARVVGGEVDAGPRPGGGFAVRARLPLAREEALA
ncbi:MAG TPA: histidine kinase [Capillimicrobium sp.]|nr:histidine kinase [Capillimicrobium sp.]